jgi:hypothetical protein
VIAVRIGESPFTAEYSKRFGVSGNTKANKNISKNVALRAKPVPIDL